MFTVTIRRSTLNKLQRGKRLFASLPNTSLDKEQRRSIHQTSPNESSVTAETLSLPTQVETDYLNRFKITGEVMVSKLFPAGFGWQSASILAEHMGFSSDSLSFALTTGMGDGIGVILGHCAFYGAKKVITGNEKILMKREFDTAILLGSAAFCSGTMWQPLVNFLQASNLSFSGVFTGTTIGCGMAFYAGLRAGRTIFPGFLKYVEEPTYENSKTDALLSIAIGSATGFFVGTDVAYLPQQNFLIDIVGIPDGTPDLVGCAIAGSSTALGFVTAQSGFNIVIPKGKCWND